MLISTVLFSLMQLLVKKLDHIPFFEIIFFRAIISFFISGYSVYQLKLSPWGNNKKMLVLRGLFGTASLTSFFYALHHVPLGTAITIVNIKPFLILLIASFVLKESISPKQWVFFLISFIGIIIVKGFDTRIDALGLASVLGAAVFAAVAHTIVRYLRNTDHPVVIIFYFTVVTLPLILPFTIWYWVQPLGYDWLMLLVIGVVTHFGQLFLTKAYQSTEMNKVSNIYYLGILFAMVYGYFFFDETFTSEVLIGLLLVVVGVLLNINFKKKLLEG